MAEARPKKHTEERNGDIEALRDVLKKVATDKELEYLVTRFESQLRWYAKEAKKDKNQYFLWATIAFVLPLLGSILNILILILRGEPMEWPDLLAAVISAGTAYSVFHLGLHRHQEHWRSYRSTLELILHEASLFCAHVAPYEDANAKRQAQFIKAVEEIMMQEMNGWLEYTSPKSNP
ncbi:MAG: DUF4231 domain-containing protein [Oscillospiraceae bacterium]|nr:DUF4231 domain-containing protein [Oscillospiraceae bacterium]